jgi:DNA-binding transcriptional LysR family regulator
VIRPTEIDDGKVTESVLETATMQDLDLNGLRVFREIVESGSFTAAADRLGIAASMVSKHLARLERQLGARLLNRTSRRMSLTEAGSLFHEQNRQALDVLDAAVASVGQASGAPRGELKVSAPVWCATPRFARMLADYRRECPEVRLDLHLDNRMVDLVSEGFDMALRMTTEPSQSLIARPLCPVTFHFVATPAYLREVGSLDEAAASRSLRMILPNYIPAERFKSPVPEINAAFKLPPVMKSSDNTLIYQAVLADMGAAFLPSWLVDEDLAAGRLALIHDARSSFTATLFAVYTSHRHLPPKLRSFIDFLVVRLGAPATQEPVPS